MLLANWISFLHFLKSTFSCNWSFTIKKKIINKRYKIAISKYKLKHCTKKFKKLPLQKWQTGTCILDGWKTTLLIFNGTLLTVQFFFAWNILVSLAMDVHAEKDKDCQKSILKGYIYTMSNWLPFWITQSFMEDIIFAL